MQACNGYQDPIGPYYARIESGPFASLAFKCPPSGACRVSRVLPLRSAPLARLLMRIGHALAADPAITSHAAMALRRSALALALELRQRLQGG